MRSVRAGLVATSFVLALAAACGSSSDSTFNPGGGSADAGPGIGSLLPGNGGGDLDGAAQAVPIEISPVNQAVRFVTGQPAPTLTFIAKITATGQQVPATFVIDRGEIGTIGLSTGLFTASGGAGGKATVTATWNGATASTSVSVNVSVVENGGAPIVDAGADGGSGGVGGVGGNGPGGAVDATTIGVLKGASVADTGLTMLYPYDQTVWPRGILAPLLMWRPGAQGDYDAIRITIHETNFDYDGTFLKNAAPFQNHPLTPAAWKGMLESNTGENAVVTITLAKGGVAYGPMILNWKIASAPLKGVVYYNSYGTHLAKNYGDGKNETGALPDGAKFGGATLAIRGSSTDPVLVAGGDGDASQCRVCHSVAANGSVLMTQRDEAVTNKFSTYDLKTSTETLMSPEGSSADWAWAGISPDGSLFLNDASDAPSSQSSPNVLYKVVSGASPQTPVAVPSTGWPSGFRAAFPVFSPDGNNVAFTKYAGIVGADKRTIAYVPFDKTKNAFGAMTELHRPSDPSHSAMYPAFLPTNNALVFEVETRSNGLGYGETRADGNGATTGAHGELWWVNVAASGATATRLDKLNGLGYIPTGPNAHDDDTTLNYEPTVNPVPSGGYAWVVFTSRRLYGNVATINPYNSDPRYTDITQTPTTKKLWVAAIDLNAMPGTDPSHPAFYLPAQELLAGNSRGYWVVDPCLNDGSDCDTGDECCGGFCRPNTSGKLVCSNVVPQCAQEFEKCSTNADCCNSPSFVCINARCAVPEPK